MARPKIQLKSWTPVMLTLLLLFTGCAASVGSRTSTSTSKLENWVPQDPWNNQKAGVCCYVYERPAATPPQPIAQAVPAAQPSSRQFEAPPDRSQELADAKALLVAKERE